LGGDGWDSASWLKSVGDAIMADFINHSSHHGSKPLRAGISQKYDERFTVLPMRGTGLGYDSARIVCDAIAVLIGGKAGLSRRRSQKRKTSTGDATGKITIDKGSATP